MTDLNIATMLAAQHRANLMAEAQRYRLARAARSSRRPSKVRRQVTATLGRLRLATRLRFRPIGPTDDALLLDAFAELSAESRRLRFNGAKTELSAREVRYLTDVDHRDHEALVAVGRFNGRGVGVVRYVRDGGERDSAEVAVTVVDRWQGRGVGAELVNRIAQRARCEGIFRFTAQIATDNLRARHLVRDGGRPAELVGRNGTTLNYSIPLLPTRSEKRRLRWYVLGPATSGCGH